MTHFDSLLSGFAQTPQTPSKHPAVSNGELGASFAQFWSEQTQASVTKQPSLFATVEKLVSEGSQFTVEDENGVITASPEEPDMSVPAGGDELDPVLTVRPQAPVGPEDDGTLPQEIPKSPIDLGNTSRELRPTETAIPVENSPPESGVSVRLFGDVEPVRTNPAAFIQTESTASRNATPASPILSEEGSTPLIQPQQPQQPVLDDDANTAPSMFFTKDKPSAEVAFGQPRPATPSIETATNGNAGSNSPETQISRADPSRKSPVDFDGPGMDETPPVVRLSTAQIGRQQTLTFPPHSTGVGVAPLADPASMTVAQPSEPTKPLPPSDEQNPQKATANLAPVPTPFASHEQPANRAKMNDRHTTNPASVTPETGAPSSIGAKGAAPVPEFPASKLRPVQSTAMLDENGSAALRPSALTAASNPIAVQAPATHETPAKTNASVVNATMLKAFDDTSSVQIPAKSAHPSAAQSNLAPWTHQSNLPVHKSGRELPQQGHPAGRDVPVQQPDAPQTATTTESSTTKTATVEQPIARPLTGQPAALPVIPMQVRPPRASETDTGPHIPRQGLSKAPTPHVQGMTAGPFDASVPMATPIATLQNAESSPALGEATEPDIALSSAPQAQSAQNAAQTAPIPRAYAPQVAQQIATAIVQSSGATTEIRLNPEELGRVRIAMTASDAGMIVSLVAERPETIDLMRRNIEHLTRELRDMGYDNPSFNFENQSGEGHADGGENTPLSDVPLAPTSTSLPESNAIRVALSGGLDLKL